MEKIKLSNLFFGDNKARLLNGSSKGDLKNLMNHLSFDSKGDLYVADKWNQYQKQN